MRDHNRLIYKSGNIDDRFIDKHLLLMLTGPLTAILLAITVVFGVACVLLAFGIDSESPNVKQEFMELLIVSLIWTSGAFGCIGRIYKLYSALQPSSSCVVVSRFNEDGINTKGFVSVSIAGVHRKIWCTSNGIVNTYSGVTVVMLIANMSNDEISKLIHLRKGIPRKNIVSIYVGAKYVGDQRDIGLIL